MRRNIGVAAVALGMGASLWLLPAASADRSVEHRGQHHGGHSQTFRVTVQEVDSAELDLGAEGFGLGDRFVFTEDLYLRGKRVGSDHGECVLTRSADEGRTGSFQCSVTLVFDRWGQITVQGVFHFDESEQEVEPFRLAVTGGTGKFRGAGGEVIVDESGEESTLLLRLTD